MGTRWDTSYQPCWVTCSVRSRSRCSSRGGTASTCGGRATATPGRGTRSSSSARGGRGRSFAGDALKAFAAGLAGWALAGWWGAWAGVAGAMAGHAFPVFARLRGGKAVMCFAGGAFVLSPYAALICLGGLPRRLGRRELRVGGAGGGVRVPARRAGVLAGVAGRGDRGVDGFIGLLFAVQPSRVATDV